MSFYVEHADTFSYEYSVLAKCETKEEAEHMRDWYHHQPRDRNMSEYNVVDEHARRGQIYQGMLDYCANERERKGYKPVTPRVHSAMNRWPVPTHIEARNVRITNDSDVRQPSHTNIFDLASGEKLLDVYRAVVLWEGEVYEATRMVALPGDYEGIALLERAAKWPASKIEVTQYGDDTFTPYPKAK